MRAVLQTPISPTGTQSSAIQQSLWDWLSGLTESLPNDCDCEGQLRNDHHSLISPSIRQGGRDSPAPYTALAGAMPNSRDHLCPRCDQYPAGVQSMTGSCASITGVSSDGALSKSNRSSRGLAY